MRPIYSKLLWAISIIVALALGFVFAKFVIIDDTSCNSDARYTNPLTLCVKQVLDKSSYLPFRDTLNEYIAEEKKQGRMAEASIYFRDLNNGPTFGINEIANFSPASLLKMPLAMAYLSYEEDNPGILNNKIKYTKNVEVLKQTFPPSKSIKIDTPYTVEEILSYLISYSDNISYGVLSDYIKQLPKGDTFVFQAYKELGIVDPVDSTDEVVTTHGYASIFRVLYNSSFVNRELSEKMLTWLTLSDFNQGLVGGLPAGILVAHKFGERAELNSVQKQLHDCGIVYYPKNPYILCVMTRGNDFGELANIIKNISKMVYNEVDSRKLK